MTDLMEMFGFLYSTGQIDENLDIIDEENSDDEDVEEEE